MREGELSPLANHGRPWKRERKRAFNVWKCVECCGVCWKIGKGLEFWKIGILVDCGGS